MTNEYIHSIELEGLVCTRTSARTYTHVVIGKRDVVKMRKQAAEANEHVRCNARYYAALVAGTHEHASQKIGDTRTGQERAIAAGYTTDVEFNTQKEITNAVARCEEAIAKGAGLLTDLQWSMTERSARSAVNKYIGYGFINVVVLPVPSRVPATKRQTTSA